MKNSDIYENLAKKSGFDVKCIALALQNEKKLRAKELSDMFFSSDTPIRLDGGTLFFTESFYPAEFFSCARQIIKSAGIRPETGFLYLYICFAEKSYEMFESVGVGDDVFFDTMSALGRETDEYFKNSGEYGLYDYVWYCNHVRANVLRLGSFEYQNGKADFENTPAKNSGRLIKNGQRAVFIHVPNATELTKSARIKSYEKARKLFGTDLFVCDSWLLYEPTVTQLAENSNIRSFFSDFDIVSVFETQERGELYRVFGRNADFSDISSLPHSTCLQRVCINRLKSGLPTGSAVGVLKITQILNNNNI